MSSNTQADLREKPRSPPSSTRAQMIARFAIASVAAGLLLFAAGIFLSEGYSVKRGFLESLPRMKIRLSGDETHARFSQVLHSEAPAGPGNTYQGEGMLNFPPMDDSDAVRVIDAFNKQHLGRAKAGHVFVFAGWVITPGKTLPLGPVLAIASALVIVGVALLVGARARHQQTTSTPMVSAEQTTRPELSQVQTPIRRSRLRFALHIGGMSRIYIGGGGLALFVGASIGLLMGRGSLLLAAIGLACFLWGITSFWTRYSAARNALLAKYTFDQLEEGNARGRVAAKARELAGVSALEMQATFSSAQLYGFYAIAMASLGVSPALAGEKWFMVSNPYRAVRGAEPELASARHYFQKKHSVSISFND